MICTIHRSACVLVCALTLCSASATYAQSEFSFDLSEEVSVDGAPVVVSLLLTNDRPIEGLAAAFQFDPAKLTVDDVDFSNGIVASADFLSTNTLVGGVTLGVVMDLMGVIKIAAGVDQLIAEITFSPLVPPFDLVPLEFVDGIGMPPVQNIYVTNGLSQGVNDGLVLDNGSVSIEAGTDVPEPTTAGLVAMAVLGLAIRRRRR